MKGRDRWQWAVLAVVLVGATMSALDVTIVNIALPDIKSQFGTTLARVEWVAIAYMLVLAVALPIVGRLADIFGRSLLYNIGFDVFVLGSALCGVAPGIDTLVIARCLQALGAALLQANSVALITQVFRRRQLGRALGMQAAFQGMAMAIGPFVGGLLITFAGWRLIFYVNVPIGIGGAIAAHFILPRHHRRDKRIRLDYLGAALLAFGLILSVLAVNTAGVAGWSSAVILAELFFGLGCLAAFVVTELRVKHPTVNLALLRRYKIAEGNVTALLAYYVLFSALFMLPFYFEQVLNYSTARAGTMLTAIPIAMAAIAPFIGRACDRFGSRKFAIGGSGLLALGSFLLVFASSTSTPLVLILDMIILGSGLGVFTPANNRATMAATPHAELGETGGLLNMMRSLGVILGVDISGMVFVAVSGAHAQAAARVHKSAAALAATAKGPFVDGLHVVMMTLVGISLLSAFLAFLSKDAVRAQPGPTHAASAGGE
jgi:EmrB/QacA subfamily drug resistance transporter